MENLESDLNYTKRKKVVLELSGCPYFGTSCDEINNTNFFVPFAPETVGMNLQNSTLVMDNGYFKRETFFIFINSAEEGGAGK
jgi:hypothetical protein